MPGHMTFYKNRQTAQLASVVGRIKTRLSVLAAKKQAVVESQLKQVEESQLKAVRTKLSQKKV